MSIGRRLGPLFGLNAVWAVGGQETRCREGRAIRREARAIAARAQIRRNRPETGHRLSNVCCWGYSRHQFRAPRCLLVAISGRSRDPGRTSAYDPDVWTDRDARSLTEQVPI